MYFTKEHKGQCPNFGICTKGIQRQFTEFRIFTKGTQGTQRIILNLEFLLRDNKGNIKIWDFHSGITKGQSPDLILLTEHKGKYQNLGFHYGNTKQLFRNENFY